jgi:leader peptidase (prepilin peptidase)/N-methyltransferase
VTLDDLPLWFLRAFAVVFGLLWGSFLNVVIWRVPRGESVVSPPSHCPSCGAPVRAWQSVPVVSWLMLRGRTGCCGQPLSARYPIVEAIGGALSLALLEARVLALSPTTSIGFALAVYVAWLALGLGLVAAAFIDLEHMFLPDSITIGGAVLGVATASFRGATFVDAALGAAIGFVVVWLPFIVVYERARGVAGMGLGDAKLLALAGAWFGWPGALVVLGAGAIQGALGTAIVLLVRGKVDEPEAVTRERAEMLAEIEAIDDPEEREEALAELRKDPIFEEGGEGLQARIPFGPFLILAILELALFEGPIFDVLLPGGSLW